MNGFHTQCVAWSSLDQQGLEFCWIEPPKAHGTILRTDDDGTPFEVRYEFIWNRDFELESALIQSQKESEVKELRLTHQAQWQKNGTVLGGFEDCLDIDLWPTPFTNSLAIKRLGLQIGENREFNVLWIEAPVLKFRKVRQCYMRLTENTYLFDEVDSGFQAKIIFDDKELVTLYPELFKRQF